jgi:hypothetical protein
MERVKYIFQHMGLGDHIMCNGIVRYYANLNDKVYVFCKHDYCEDVNYMFRDDKRIELIPVVDYDDAKNMVNSNPHIKQNLIVVGGEGTPEKNIQHVYYYLNRGERLDRVFYDMAEVPFENKTALFHFNRNVSNEKKLIEDLNPSNVPYIFMHDDPSRGFNMNMDKIRKDFLIIRPAVGYKIFDYLGLLENAEEIHVMESCFQVLIDTQSFEKPSLFLHRYIRNYNDFMLPEQSNNYKMIY